MIKRFHDFPVFGDSLKFTCGLVGGAMAMFLAALMSMLGILSDWLALSFIMLGLVLLLFCVTKAAREDNQRKIEYQKYLASAITTLVKPRNSFLSKRHLPR